ncbi:MAG TPA: serine/threonine-protein kinase [Polyangiaceae bacterium]|nr:serine/threonine-protein kinase [Polyangiaceae bacterium]
MSGPLFEPGEIIADVYEVRALLGAGAMGEVYDAHDRALNRRVALKVERPDVAPDYLLREGRALAAIRHPGVVTVHTLGRHRGVAFLVLERVYGLSLDRMIDDRRGRGERFAVGEALDLLVAIADALRVVHGAGLVHRDVKPANIMLAPGGRVVLMDFGLVLPHADRAGHRTAAGSLQYMGPEALTGDIVEGAAALLDVYAVGVLAYELLCGIAPFDGGDTRELYRSKVRKPGPSVARLRPDVPSALRELVAQLMASDPQERPQGAEAVLWQLRALRARVGAAPEARPFSVLIVDDDEDMRRALALYVRAAAAGAEIETTGEGRQAIRAVRRRVPDLLLVDLDLPDINGIEVCMLLRGMRLGDACLIVSISSRATPADVELLQQLGVRSLEKGPALVTQLAEIIERIRPNQ